MCSYVAKNNIDFLSLIKTKNKVSSKDISTTMTQFDESHPLYNKVCVFTGTLEKMARIDAMQKVADFGGFCADNVTKKTNYLILGNNDYCSTIRDGKSTKQKKAEQLKLSDVDIKLFLKIFFMICYQKFNVVLLVGNV